MDTTLIHLDTGRRRGVIDITAEIVAFTAGKGDGLLSIFAPHATAGLAIIETGAGTDADLMDILDELMPRDDNRYRHRHGSPGHGADHILPALVPPTLIVPVVEGRPALGTWQSIVLVDPNQDNPKRSIRLSFFPG